jgi:hypothetical protein
MLLLYNFWLRLSSLFNPKKNLGRFAGLVFAILFAAFYGLLFGYLFGSEDWEEVDLSSRDNFLIGVAAFFFFMTILKGFYPSYKQLGTWVRPFFPLTKFQRYNLKLSADLASAFFIPAFIFIISFCLMANELLGWTFIIKFVIILLGANIIRRMIQAVIEYKFQGNQGLFLLLILGTAGLIGIQIFYPIYGRSPVWSDISTLALLYGSGLIIEEYLSFERKKTVQVSNGKTNIITSLLIKNKKVRSAILVAMLFKVGILAGDTFLFNKSGEHLFNSDAMLWLFVSPVVVFNYVFNNTWGYYRNLWLTLDKAPNPGKVLRNFYLRLVWPPLAFDFMVTFVYLLFRPEWFNIGLISYIITTIISVVFGFYWSILKPKLIMKSISTKSNTYVWSNILGMLFVFLTFGMLYTKWLYWLVPVYLIISALVYFYSSKEYAELRKKIFKELFKD